MEKESAQELRSCETNGDGRKTLYSTLHERRRPRNRNPNPDL